MTVKLTGAEWAKFYADKAAWPDGMWHEGEEIKVDGVVVEDLDLTEIPATSRMTLTGGVIFLDETTEGPSVESHFRKWRKQQTTTVLFVRVPHEKFDAVHAAILSAGGTLLN